MRVELRADRLQSIDSRDEILADLRGAGLTTVVTTTALPDQYIKLRTR